MTGFEMAALAAMLGGATLQYSAQQQAAQRQEEETRKALARQAEFQRQAEQKALGQAQEFTTDNRAQQQQAIEQQLTEEFIKPVQSAQEINAAQSTTQGAVSDDYNAAKARSNLETMKSAEQLARLLGKTTAAGRLRNNEAIRVADTAAGIDRLGNFSRGQMGADQIGIQAAGRPDAGLMLLGGLAQAAGTYGVMSGAGAANSAAAGSTTGVNAGELGSGMYQTATPTGIGAMPSVPQNPGATGLGSGFWGLNNDAMFSFPKRMA